jgi:hypothetical protein
MEEISERSKRKGVQLRRLRQLSQDGFDDEFLEGLGDYTDRNRKKKGRKEAAVTSTRSDLKRGRKKRPRRKRGGEFGSDADTDDDEEEVLDIGGGKFVVVAKKEMVDDVQSVESEVEGVEEGEGEEGYDEEDSLVRLEREALKRSAKEARKKEQRAAKKRRRTEADTDTIPREIDLGGGSPGGTKKGEQPTRTTGGGRGGPPRTTPMTNRLIVKAVASVAKAPASEKKEKVKLVKALTKEGSTVRTAASAFPPTEDSQDVYEQVKSVHESL